MVSNQSQICGKCYKLLPDADKSKYIRQIGLEAVSTILIFPCRYHNEGCTFTYSFNSTDGHEKECSYRHQCLYQREDQLTICSESELIPISVDNQKFSNHSRNLSINQESGDVRVKVDFELKQNNMSNNNALLKYNVEICGTDKSALCIQSEQYMNPVKITTEGVVSLRRAPESVYCDVKVDRISGTRHSSGNGSEPIYDTIDGSSQTHKCTRCSSAIAGEAFYCLHGHQFCRNCREKYCMHCATSVSCIPKYRCKNAAQGCKQKLSTTDVSKHETDCEFNSFRCPISGCNWHGILKITKSHVLEKHLDKIMQVQEIRKPSSAVDETWYMVVYDSIFRCKYFFYDDYAELLVIYIGSNDNAQKFKYEVEVFFHGKCFKRSSLCIGWNGFSLDRGIVIKQDCLNELLLKPKNDFKFEYSLRLIDTSTSM